MSIRLCNRYTLFLIVAAFVKAGSNAAELPVQDISDRYEWDRVRIGGGGYQTGVVTDVDQPGLLYMKGDVMGLHRRMPGDERWAQTMFVMNPEEGLYGGTGGIGIGSGGTVYTLLGLHNSARPGIYKSTDYGDTWVYLLEVYEHTNGGDERKWANNVAVDPNNRSIVYFGTRRDGLIRTVDGGANFDFKPHPDIPLRPDQALGAEDRESGSVGSRNVVIDAAETIGSPTRSKIIYVGVYGEGVYQSTDGGTSFALTDGSPERPQWMRLAADRSLYVLDRYVPDSTDSGLWRLQNGEWTHVKAGRFEALGVNPHDPDGNSVFVARGGTVHRTANGGDSWEELTEDNGGWAIEEQEWKRRVPFAATASFDFDQAIPDRLYMCDAFGVWVTDTPWDTPVVWRSMHEGCEGTVSFGLSAPPDNGNIYPLYSGGSDGNNYAHVNPTREYVSLNLNRITPPNEGTQWLAYIADFDYCAANPDVMYRVSQAHNQRQYLCKTTNGGKRASDWEVISSSAQDDSPLAYNGRTRKLAVSSTDPDVVLMAGRSGYGNHYTTDGGQTWQRMEGVTPDNQGFISEGGWRMYGRDKPIAADRVDGNYFYAVFQQGNRFPVRFFRSNDYARNGSWEETFSIDEGRQPNDWQTNPFHLQAAPDNAGHVAINLGRTGLWLTRDHAQTFERIEGVEDCRSVGWGKKSSQSDYSTLYVHAKINDQWGIYASIDLGQTWFKLTPDHIQFSNAGNLTGDLQTFGTVYFSVNAMGIAFGRADGTVVAAEDFSAPGTVSTTRTQFNTVNRLSVQNKKGILAISGTGKEMCRVELFDIAGRLRGKWVLQGESVQTVSVRMLPSGAYLVRVQAGGKRVSVPVIISGR